MVSIAIDSHLSIFSLWSSNVTAARKSSTPRAGPATPLSHVVLEPYNAVVPEKSCEPDPQLCSSMAIRDYFDAEIDDLENVGTNATLKTLETFMSSKTRLREGGRREADVG